MARLVFLCEAHNAKTALARREIDERTARRRRLENVLSWDRSARLLERLSRR